MNTFTIKDLENLSGIKAHTIRIWEQRYSFLKPNRTGTNIRYYCNDELKTILNVALLNKYGYKISHINKMNAEEITQRIIQLHTAEATQERIVNELLKCMIDMNTQALDDELNKYIRKAGIEKAIIQIIFPFLEKVGLLWQTGHIIPAQEHLISNIVRAKIILGIEALNTSIRINKKILLFLPENEYHEMGLLFVHYLLKSRGIEVIYLGANVPLKDAQFVITHTKPAIIFSHITTVSTQFVLDKFIKELSKNTGTTIIISGKVVQMCKRPVPANTHFKTSLAEVMEFIASI